MEKSKTIVGVVSLSSSKLCISFRKSEFKIKFGVLLKYGLLETFSDFVFSSDLDGKRKGT
jgi:hypothetical protein